LYNTLIDGITLPTLVYYTAGMANIKYAVFVKGNLHSPGIS